MAVRKKPSVTLHQKPAWSAWKAKTAMTAKYVETIDVVYVLRIRNVAKESFVNKESVRTGIVEPLPTVKRVRFVCKRNAPLARKIRHVRRAPFVKMVLAKRAVGKLATVQHHKFVTLPPTLAPDV